MGTEQRIEDANVRMTEARASIDRAYFALLLAQENLRYVSGDGVKDLFSAITDDCESIGKLRDQSRMVKPSGLNFSKPNHL